ncbi:MAG: hypothetical protein GF344_20375 [Chitinivibrionales bacterium]|nr:hypothetical protein [Chitinivibrionales bacterium]MBD3358958.1 hypothetical protein [Chitinivibrionales bacterium]
MNSLKTIVRILATALLVGRANCSSPPPKTQPASINVEHEKLFIASIGGKENLKAYPGWPTNERVRELLLDNVRQVRANLIGEFMRCRKYGLYSVVDSHHAPTVRIELTMDSLTRRGDTLFAPMTAHIHIAASRRTIKKSLEGVGVAPAGNATNSTDLHWLGHVLADYRRRFPYHRFVAAFYPSYPRQPSSPPR